MKQEIIKQLEKTYGFRVVGEPTDIGGLSNENIKVQTDKGDFVIKRYKSSQDEYRRGAEHAILQHLLAKDFPYFARPLTTSSLLPWSKKETIAIIDNEAYAVFEFVEGTGFSGRTDEVIDAGRKLGHLHHAIEDFTYTKPIRPKTISIPDSIEKRLLDAIEVLAHSSTEESREVTKDIQTVIELLPQTRKNVASHFYDKFPIHHLHSDYHPGNLVFTGDGSVACILDFEAIHKYGPRIIDISGLIHDYCAHYTQDEKKRWTIDYLDTQKFVGFVRGYEETNPLLEDERNALVDAAISHKLEYLVYFTEKYARQNAPDLATKIRDYTKLIKLFHEQRDKLTALLHNSDSHVVTSSCTDPAELYQQATGFYKQGDFDRALGLYDALLEQDPTHVWAHYDRGETLIKLGQHGEGITSMKAAQNLLPDNAVIKQRIAELTRG